MFDLPEDTSITKDPATEKEEEIFFKRISTFSKKDKFPTHLILKLFYIYEIKKYGNTINNFFKDYCLNQKIIKQISQILKINDTPLRDLISLIEKIMYLSSESFEQRMFDVIFCTEKSTCMGISTLFKIELFQNYVKCSGKNLILSFFRFGADFFFSKCNNVHAIDVKYILFCQLSHLHLKNITLLDIFEAIGSDTAYFCIYQKENYQNYLSTFYLKSKELLECVKNPISFGNCSIYWNTKLHLFPVNKKRKTQYGTTMTLMLSIKRLQKQICKNDPALFELMFESLNGVDLTHFLLN